MAGFLFGLLLNINQRGPAVLRNTHLGVDQKVLLHWQMGVSQSGRPPLVDVQKEAKRKPDILGDPYLEKHPDWG